MTPFELLEDQNFRESLDVMHKGYIEQCYRNANLKVPIPISMNPLTYSDPKIEKGLNQLRQGAKNALFAYTQHLKNN